MAYKTSPDKGSKKDSSIKKGRRKDKRDERKAAALAAGADSESPSYMKENSGKGSNDKEWYAKHPELLRDVASFSYGIPLGRPINLGLTTDLTTLGSGKTADVTAASLGTISGIPGVMAFYCSPTIGQSLDPTSPINVAMSKFYADLRFANNASNVPYEAADLGIYLVGMDSCYSYLAYLRRIYGLARTYSVTNRYLPEALFAAMNVDYSDVLANLADFRAAINTFAVQLSAKALPAGFSYTQRHIWMYDYIYADSPTDKAQIYLYVPHAFYQYAVSGSGTTRKGSLKYAIAPGSASAAATVSDLIGFGQDLLAPIINDEDYNIMAGDIRKAYGSSLMSVPAIAENYTIVPLYNQEVLQQIENLTMVGYYGSDGSSDITQSTSAAMDAYLEFNPHVVPHLSGGPVATLSDSQLKEIAANTSAKILGGNTYLNFHHGDITPGDSMEASRLTNILVYDTAEGYYTIPTLGSDVCHSGIIYYYYVNTSGQNVLGQSPYIYTDMHQGVAEAILPYLLATNGLPRVARYSNSTWEINAMRIQAMLSMFDWHPRVHFYYLNTVYYAAGVIDQASAPVSPPAPWTVSGYTHGLLTTLPLQDMDVFTIITSKDLEAMSFVALMSQFWSADPQRSN